MAKPGLYANIHAKKARIAAGSGEKMRKPGAKGAPSKQDFIKSALTAYRGFIGINEYTDMIESTHIQISTPKKTRP